MARKDLYEQVIQQIQAGDPMSAYSVFEQLPFTDQMGLYLTPGVGDAIAAVEAGVYNERAKQNFMEGNIGSGLLDTVIGGTAAASTIPFAGKVAEGLNLGAKGLNRGIATLRSRMGDGMSGGGGGGIRTSQPEIDKLEAKKKELIKDYEVMTERMPESAARRYYPSDEIDEIDNQIYDLMSTSRGQSTSRVFRNDGSVSAAEKVDGEVGRLIDQGFEGDNFMFNQDFSVPVRMQGTNRKTGEMIEIETIPSQDGNIGMTITKLDNPAMAGEKAVAKDLVAANNKEQIANRIQRELELEGGDMAPATQKRLESKLRTLRKEIAELRGS